MSRAIAALFLIAHGAITAGIWISPQRSSDMPGFGSEASWLFVDSRPTVVGLALVSAVAFALAGAAVLTGHQWWAPVAMVGAATSLARLAATFTPWWSAAIAIDLVIIYLAWGTAVSQFTAE